MSNNQNSEPTWNPEDATFAGEDSGKGAGFPRNSQTFQPPKQKKSDNNKVIAVLLSVVIVLLVIIGFGLYLLGNAKKDSNTSAEAPSKVEYINWNGGLLKPCQEGQNPQTDGCAAESGQTIPDGVDSVAQGLSVTNMSCGQADTMCFDVTHALIENIADYAETHPEESVIPTEFKDVKVTYTDPSQGEDIYNCKLGTYSAQSKTAGNGSVGASLWECRSQESPRQLWCDGHCFSAAVPVKGKTVPPQNQMGADDPYWKERAQAARENIATTAR